MTREQAHRDCLSRDCSCVSGKDRDTNYHQVIDQIFDEHETLVAGLKQIIQNQSDLLEMYSKDNEVPNNAILIKQLSIKDTEIIRLKEQITTFEAIKHLTCEGCDNEGCDHVFSPCDICSRKFSDNYEPKK